MVEQAKAIQLAKELAAMKPADLERELSEDPISQADRPARPAAESSAPAAAAAAVTPAAARAPTVFEEAIILRQLLFSVSTPVRVVAAAPAGSNAHRPGTGSHALASASAPAITLPRHSGRRRRR